MIKKSDWINYQGNGEREQRLAQNLLKFSELLQEFFDYQLTQIY
ncbi:MAG: hypothetical protein V7K21_08005 [Nostoc sp.]